MTGLLQLAGRYALHHRARSVILVLCLSLAGALPLTTGALMGRYRSDLEARGASSPILVGPEGNRFDLTLGALYFRDTDLPPLRADLTARVEAELAPVGGGVVVPLHTRSHAQGFPVVGTSPEYYHARRLTPIRGSLPLLVGDALLGARVAAAQGLGVGDVIASDPTKALDIAELVSVELNIVGVLAASGTPDDGAVFVDLKTAWALEGLGHGHADVTGQGALPEGYVLSRTEDQVALSPAFIEERRLTAENLAGFHLHGDADAMPLSAVLVFPANARAGDLMAPEVDDWVGLQAVRPETVVADLLAFVLEIKTLFDRLSAVLVLSTILFAGLVLTLSARLRADEFRTLHAIGCGRRAVWTLLAWEAAGLIALGALVALLWSALTQALLPNLIQTL
ncbi:MAG: hypothetical protein O2816_04105 [Planctomycetota bacterium]|nr:hypothetical protein [Planctomycetota bacterium]